MEETKLIRANIGLLGIKWFVDIVVGVSVGVPVGNVGVSVGEFDGVCAGGELIGCIVVGLIYAVIDTL